MKNSSSHTVTSVNPALKSLNQAPVQAVRPRNQLPVTLLSNNSQQVPTNLQRVSMNQLSVSQKQVVGVPSSSAALVIAGTRSEVTSTTHRHTSSTISSSATPVISNKSSVQPRNVVTLKAANQVCTSFFAYFIN